MSIIQGTSKSSAAAAYTIDQSIRFNDDDSAYLSRTPGSAGNRKTWTFSSWVKRANLFNGSVPQIIFSAANGSTLDFIMQFQQSDDTLRISDYSSGSASNLITTQLFRDPSAWYHFVLQYDTTQATSSDRMKLYVNGTQVTAFSTASYPSLNYDSAVNNNLAHNISRGAYSANGYFDGYQAEINFIDGTALDPTSFGETNADTGQWVPVRYAGSYGTNGFYITGANSADLGADDSGNGNNFTSSGLTAADQVSDSPTDNYVTLNPLQKGSNVTLSDGNLVADCGSGSSSTRAFATASMPNSGKWTFQIEAVSSTLAGTDSISSIGIITNPEATNTDVTTGSKIGQTTNQENAGLDFYNGFTKKDNASQITAAQLRNAGDKGIVAYDASTKELWIGYAQSTDSSWTWVGGGNPETGTTPTYTMTNDDMRFAISSDRSKTIVRFGSTGDGIAPPSGFNYLNTANLPDPTIADPSAYFQTTLYTGNGTAIGSGGNAVTQIGNSTFQPDFVWMKSRSAATDHALYDAVRGTTKEVISNSTAAESTLTEGLTTFGAAGFTVGSDAAVNTNTATYAAWQWLAANGTASNTDGDITSTVSANPTSGVSVLTYSGNGSDNQTIGHGLGIAPKMIWTKRLNATGGWTTYHDAVGINKVFYLNSTSAPTSNTEQYRAVPTSSVYTVGVGGDINSSSGTYVAYCFAEVEGFSKFGSFTGNGSSTDGPFIYTGFTPEFFMWKRTNSSTYGDWTMMDTARDPFNMAERNLRANSTIADDTGEADLDFVSNGIKHRGGASARFNQSGATYIYMAFAETPFKTATAQ